MIYLLNYIREIIYFLVKKLQIEEQQRLKTEEQASKMIYSMEKTVKQLVTIIIFLLNNYVNRRRRALVLVKKEPFGQLDLNKSISSQMTSKFDTSDHML